MVQGFGQFGAVKDGVFELLPESQRTGGAGFHAEAAEGAHFQVIDVLVEDPFHFPFGIGYPVGKHLDGAIRAVHFTDTAAGTMVVVIGIVGHDDLPFVAVGHSQGIPVFRILVGDDFAGRDEILAGDAHASPQGGNGMVDIFEIVQDAVHKLNLKNLEVPSHQGDESHDHDVDQAEWHQVFPFEGEELVDAQAGEGPFKPHDDIDQEEGFQRSPP